MGYTHYWEFGGKIPMDAWQLICQDAAALIKTAPCQIVHTDGVFSPPIMDENVIHFNGYADEDAHEDFYFERNSKKVFNFCKTARKPYDIVVTAILACVAERAGDYVKIGSDGASKDWSNSLDWASKVLGRTLTCPI